MGFSLGNWSCAQGNINTYSSNIRRYFCFCLRWFDMHWLTNLKCFSWFTQNLFRFGHSSTGCPWRIMKRTTAFRKKLGLTLSGLTALKKKFEFEFIIQSIFSSDWTESWLKMDWTINSVNFQSIFSQDSGTELFLQNWIWPEFFSGSVNFQSVFSLDSVNVFRP